MKQSIKFSIIVPVYNVKDYLDECLQSIAKQSYTDFECLIIDDGSTDSSGDVAIEFCKNHQNFLYFKKENGGLSDARNYGLNKAQKEYIVFVDSDDVLDVNLLKFVVEAIKQNDAELVYFSLQKFLDGEPIKTENNHSPYFKTLMKEELLRKPNFACARVCKKSLYNNNLFPKGVIYEDAVTSPILAFLVDKIVEIDKALYFYRKRDGSITTALTSAAAEKQFLLFDSLNILKERCHSLSIPRIYYVTTFVNLSKSIMASLCRLNDKNKFSYYLHLSWKELRNVPFLEGMKSYSSFSFKIYFILLKMKYFGIPLIYLIRFLMKLIRK